jgi:1,4-dihydroxy-2-naphthoate octaprenyltransferase
MSTVIANQSPVDGVLLLLCLAGALLAHVSVNALNEYMDFNSGLDLATVRTPFSGGSGALPQYPEMARAVLVLGVVTLVGVMLVGLYFLRQYGLAILPIGLAGLLLVVFYTGWANRHPFICLVAPGLGFGVLMVVGTQYVLQGQYSPLSLLAAVVPFFLVNNLLLLNQYPDIKADRGAGRRHFPITYGTAASTGVYGFFVLLTIATIVTGVLSGHFPRLSLIALLPMPLAFYAISGAMRHGAAIGGYPQYLGANVAVVLLTTVLLGVSLVLG